jgi:hypothetical protein
MKRLYLIKPGFFYTQVGFFTIGIYKIGDEKPKMGSPEHIEQVRKKVVKISQELFGSSKIPDFKKV